MTGIRWAAFVVMALSLPAVLPGQPKRTKSLLVLTKADKTLSIVAPATLKVIAKMSSGPDPHEVVASSDGHYSYVPNYGFGVYYTFTTVDLLEHRTLSAADPGPTAWRGLSTHSWPRA